MQAAPVPWRDVFGNDRAVEVEVGPGRGELVLGFAAAEPTTNFFAIERAPGAAEAIAAKAARRALTNVRVVAGDARWIVRCCLAETSVAAYHIYFPDPWPKTRHRSRRLASEPFARDLVRTLVPGGALHLASDLRPLVADFTTVLERAGLVVVPDAAPPPHRPTTSFERRYAQAGTYYVRLLRLHAGERRGLRLPLLRTAE